MGTGPQVAGLGVGVTEGESRLAISVSISAGEGGNILETSLRVTGVLFADQGQGSTFFRCKMKFWISLYVGCLCSMALIRSVRAEDKPPALTPDLGATVLGKEIDLNQIVYRVQVTEYKTKLPSAEFETWLRKHKQIRLFDVIKTRVMQDYVTREQFSPSDEDLKKIFQEAVRKYPENFDTTDQEAQLKIGLSAAWAWGMSKDWRLARALHQKYGGRVALGSLGAIESFEGRNAVLNEYVDRGDITFPTEDLKRAFFERMQDERIQDVTLPVDRTREYFQKPSPWEDWLAEQAKQNAEIKAERKANPQPAPAPPK